MDKVGCRREKMAGGVQELAEGVACLKGHVALDASVEAEMPALMWPRRTVGGTAGSQCHIME
jgi:hypothetical protein